MASQSLGSFVDRHTIRFELYYPHPREAVWAALTDESALAVWFMPMTIDLREGGAVTLRYSSRPERVPAEGTVTELVPHEVIEYHFEKGPWEWPAGELRFELSDRDNGTQVVFTQRIAEDTVWSAEPDGQVGGPGTIHPGACAGWHGFFDPGLAAFLDGHGGPVAADHDDPITVERTAAYRQMLLDLLGQG